VNTINIYYCSLFSELVSTFCTSTFHLHDFTSVLYTDQAVSLAVCKVDFKSDIEDLYIFHAVETAVFTSDLVGLSQAAKSAVFLVAKTTRALFWYVVKVESMVVSLFCKAVFTQVTIVPESICPGGIGSLSFISLARTTAPRTNQIIGRSVNVFFIQIVDI